MSLWPRCCSNAFIGIKKLPAKLPISTNKNIATIQSVTIAIATTTNPIAIPKGNTLTACSKGTAFAAITEPMARPTATRAVNCVDCSRSSFKAKAAQARIMNRRLVPAPQNKEVTARDTCPKGSLHSSKKLRQKSNNKNPGVRFVNTCSIGSLGMK